jgi:hypothetical protein
MANLKTLPEELIHHIVSFLSSASSSRPKHLSFHAWADDYSADPATPDEGTSSLLALTYTSRRLNELISPHLYHTIRIPKSRDIPRLELLAATLAADTGLAFSVQDVSITGENSDSPWRLLPFFFLENINTLTVYNFRGWNRLEWEDDEDEVDENTRISATSSVRVLRLLNCGAHEPPLAQLLAWPKALEELHYDVDQLEWEGTYEGRAPISWTCDAFVRALQPQKLNLKTLTLTRPPLIHEGIFNGVRISLVDFTALTTLRIFHVFFCGWDAGRDAWMGLPPNIEVLEVFYDDTELSTFVANNDDGEWLDELAVKKRGGFYPQLRSVCVRTMEEIYGGDDNEVVTDSWSIPTSLAHTFEELGIELRVILGVKANQKTMG